MDVIEFLRDNWDLIQANPWVFIVCAFLSGWIGWALRGLLRRNEAVVRETPRREQFQYPEHGRHGANLLNTALEVVKRGVPISMRADIPRGKRLRVKLTGPLPQFVEDTYAAWRMNVSMINWSADQYHDLLRGDLPTQSFVAEAGTADLRIYLDRIGRVLIQAFEDDAREPTWEKTIQVTEG